MMRHQRRILLIAEAANPEWVSVPLIGWSLSRALASVTDLHLVTHIRNKGAVERAGLIEGHDFTTIDNEYMARPMWWFADRLRGGVGKGWTTATAFSSLAYYSFERELWRRFSKRIAAGEFDLVHRITPLSPTHPSPIAKRLWKLKVPFVIGPLNGGVPWPKNFRDRRYAEKEWLSHIRGAYKLMPSSRATRWYSSAIITGSKHTFNEMPGWAKSKCSVIPENGFDTGRFDTARTRSASLPLRAAFVGRLVPYKGTDILLEAVAEFLRNGTLELHIVGDGPQRAELEKMITRLGVAAKVRLHGWVPHMQVSAILKECDFLALPSVREFGGGVVVEAMALGVAPIVADYAGPSELVDDKTGIRVPFTDRQTLLDGFKQTISGVIQNPGILEKLGTAAREKAYREFTWTAKARQILTIYGQVLAGD